jgi:hypothetical protein
LALACCGVVDDDVNASSSDVVTLTSATAEDDLGAVAHRLIREKLAKDATLTIHDATSWARRELPEAAFAAMRREGEDDSDAARARWDQRQRGGWSTASYSSGSYMVTGPQPKPPRGSSDYVGPKPPTRDEWWERADPETRAEWVLAFFAEESDLFEVGARTSTECPTCSGKGLETVTTVGGQPQRRLCLRCVGTGHDIAVRFR